MSDEVDIAADVIEMQTQAAIRACAQAETLPAKGSCWFCDEPVAHPRKFCDRDCSSDYEREQNALLRAGRYRTSDPVWD